MEKHSMALTKRRFVKDEFSDCTVDGGTVSIYFTGWNSLLIGETIPDIYHSGPTVYLIYKNFTLNRDLRDIHVELDSKSSIKRAWLDPLFGDMVIETPMSGSRVRILTRACDFLVFHRREEMTEKRFILDEFNECSEEGDTFHLNHFIGWDDLFDRDPNPDIYQNGSSIYMAYERCTLNEDLTKAHRELKQGVKIPQVWIDILRGDAVIKTPLTKARVRIVMVSLDLKILTPK